MEEYDQLSPETYHTREHQCNRNYYSGISLSLSLSLSLSVVFSHLSFHVILCVCAGFSVI